MHLLDIAALASEQWGLVTTAQAVEAGVSAKLMARWAKDGALERLSHGVYKLAGAGYDPREDLRAAWLSLDPKRMAADRIAASPIDAVVSHRSAALLHGLGDLDADLHEFTLQKRKQSRQPDVRLRQKSKGIDHGSWTLVGGLPVTTVLTTIVDLAADGIDGGHLAGVVRDAIATSVVDLAKLSEELRPYAHRYGVLTGDGLGLVQRLLDEAPLPQTTVQAAKLMDDSPSSAEIRKLAVSDPVMLQAVSDLSASPELLKTIDTISSPEMQRNLSHVHEVLTAFRRAAG